MAHRSRIWPNTKTKPPFRSVEIDWAHPLAKKLAFLCIFNEGGGSTGDLVSKRFGIPTNSPVWRSSPDTIAADMPASGSAFFDFSIPDDTPFLGDLSISWRGLIRDVSNYQHFCGKHTSNGANNNPFDFRTDVGGPGFLALIRGNDIGGTISMYSNGGTLAVLNEIKTYAVTCKSPSTTSGNAFYIDGISGGDSGFSENFLTATGTSANIRVGRRDDGEVQLDGYVSHLFIWSRFLSAQEMLWNYEEPYALLRPVVRRRYFIAAASANPYITGTLFDNAIEINI